MGCVEQGDTSGDYKKLLLKLCGGSDWKRETVCRLLYRSFFKYSLSESLSVCTIHTLHTCMPCQCFQCKIYLALKSSYILLPFYKQYVKNVLYIFLFVLYWPDMTVHGFTKWICKSLHRILKRYIYFKKIFIVPIWSDTELYLMFSS